MDPTVELDPISRLMGAAEDATVKSLLLTYIEAENAFTAQLQAENYPGVPSNKLEKARDWMDLIKAALAYQVGRDRAEMMIEGARAVSEEK